MSDLDLIERLRKMLGEGLPAKLTGEEVQEIITALEAAEERIAELENEADDWRDRYDQAQKHIAELEKHRLKNCPECDTPLNRIDETGPAYCPDEACAWSEWVDSHKSTGYVERLELYTERLDTWLGYPLDAPTRTTGGTMKDTYTKDDFRKAMIRANFCDDPIELVLSKLDLPPIDFAEGEVAVIYENGQFDQYGQVQDPRGFAEHYPEARKLTTTESGAQELLDALQEIADKSQSVIGRTIALCAKEKWLQDRGEDR